MEVLKYITFTGNEVRYDGKQPERKQMAIIFPAEVTHKNAARGLHAGMNLQCFPNDLIGAGFARWTGMRFVVSGHSETLDLLSRGELDAVVINKQLGIE